jgi:hypothetical protein
MNTNPISPERALQLQLVDELRGTTCLCGGAKVKNRSVCYACWKRLPRSLRDGLYQRIGEGYERAHAKAKAHLTAK